MTEDPHVPHLDISLAPGNSSSSSPTMVHTIDLPIVLRKGAYSCVKYPIANHASYSALFPSTHSFSIELCFISIPNNVLEALSQPK